ncbi:MAG: DUF2808 domain-containing protein [Synechococcales cyanobacterium T60_A2020_003]|nr:DUF2808 domain-containing protein [Synechococcales cyanobacterium T60_A2020_003]
MPSKSSIFRPCLPALAIAGVFVTGVSSLVQAQSMPGITVFSGIDRENQLSYYLDYGGIPSRPDRYHLKVPPRKMELAVSEFAVSYPESFTGTFDVDDVRVEVDGETVDIDEVVWDEENRLIRIYLTEPAPAASNVELVFSNMRNPRSSGMHYFNCLVVSPGDSTALLRYIGTWIISIGGV